MQVLTFINQQSGAPRVVVLPADSTLVSGVNRDIHLYASGDLYGALNAVLQDLRRRIAKWFRSDDTSEPPVLLECEAPCRCLQCTVSRAMPRDGEGSACVVDLDNARNVTTGSGISATEAQDILSVMQKMQSTLEEMDHRIRNWASSPTSQQDIDLRAEQAHTTVPTPHKEVTATDDQSLIGKSSVSSEGFKPETKHPPVFLGGFSTMTRK